MSKTLTFIIRSTELDQDLHPKELLPSETLKYVKHLEDALKGMDAHIELLSGERFLSLDKVRDKCVAVDMHAPPKTLDVHHEIERAVRQDAGASLTVSAYQALMKLRELAEKRGLSFEVSSHGEDAKASSWVITQDTELVEPTSFLTSRTSISGTVSSLDLERSTFKLRQSKKATLVKVACLSGADMELILKSVSRDAHQRFRITGEASFDTKKYRYLTMQAEKVEAVERLDEELFTLFRRSRGPVRNLDEFDPTTKGA